MIQLTSIRTFVTLALVASMGGAICFAQESGEQPDGLDPYELAIQHAKTNLDLADVELKRHLEMNAKQSGVVPRLTIERLRSDLAVAEEKYNQARLASTGGPERVRLRHAEEKVRVAKIDLDAGRQLQKSGEIKSLEFKRLYLKHKLAELNLVLIQNPENYVTLMDIMQHQIDRMGDEILSLDQRLTILESIMGQ